MDWRRFAGVREGMTMNKSDLIESIIEKGKLPRKSAEQVVNLIFEQMTAALAQDERIEIRGFGSFVSKRYRARTGRNPQTNERILSLLVAATAKNPGCSSRKRCTGSYSSSGNVDHPGPKRRAYDM